MKDPKMSRKEKLLERILKGTKNVRFDDLVALALAVGYHLDRTQGSHHIYIHPDIPELLNLQNHKGKAKPYQVKQLMKFIEKYNLKISNEEDDEP